MTSLRRLASTTAVAVATAILASAATAPAALADPTTSPAPSRPAQGAPAKPPAKPPANAITWAVQPSTAKGPDGRSTFTYSNLKPRTVVHDYVGVTNYSKRPITFKVYATDAFVTPAGALDLLPANQKPVDVGAWVRVQRTSVTVPAGARVNEPITLSVPDNATPGDHSGGIVASISVTTKNAKGDPVIVDRRLGVPVYLRVSGPLQPALSVDSLSTGFHGTVNPFGSGGTSVSYTVHNIGNLRLSGSQTVSVTGPFGITLATVHPANLPQLLPGDSFRVTTRVPGVFPAGPLTAHVKVTPSQVDGVPRVSTPLRTVSRSGSLWAPPWSQLVLLLVVIAAGVGAWWWLRRRRRRQASAVAAAVERGRREAAQELAQVGGTAGDTSASVEAE